MADFLSIKFWNNGVKQFGKYKIDINLLVIFILVAQYSFVIKFVGIGILVLLNFKNVVKIKPSQIPLFYTIIPTIEVLKFFFLDPDFSAGHISQVILGLIYWLASLIVCWVIFNRISSNEIETTDNSIKLFSLINLIFSFAQIIDVCLIEHVINPYNTGHHHPYGISSGDLVNGVLHGVHLTNAFVSLLLVLYFTGRRSLPFIFVSLCPILLCGSNYAIITLLFCLAVYFLLSTDKSKVFKMSSMIFVVIVLFYWLITPMNAAYTLNKVSNLIIKKPIVSEQYQQEVDAKSLKFLEDSILKSKGKIYSGNYDSLLLSRNDLDSDEREALERILHNKSAKKYNFDKVAGKKTAYKQTFAFLKSNPKYFLFGSGLGGFSSNIAFNFSGAVDNSSMSKYFPHYEKKSFRENHKSIYEYLKTSHIIFHSESNKPFSVYNQLLGEYGIIGLLSFIIFYVFYFLRRINKRNYALPVMLALLLALNLNYFLESLSLLLFFETIMFINIKQERTSND